MLRAIVQGRPVTAVLQGWEKIRDELVNEGPLQGHRAGGRTGAHTRRGQACMDRCRPARLAGTECAVWLARGGASPGGRARAHGARHDERGEFARQILDHWGVHLADIQGKEAGTHKCENLRALIADYTAVHGRRPRLWFVEDRLETLQHVTTHADLTDVGLFLAAWGYNTRGDKGRGAGRRTYPPAGSRSVQARPCRHGSEARFPKTMALALLKLPLPVLALLVVGLPVLLAVVGLLLVRSCAPHPRLQPHHDGAGYIYAGLAVLYAVLLAFIVIVVWQQFNATHIRVHKEADALSDLFREAQVFPTPVQRPILDAVRSYARAVIEEEWPAMARGTESSTA